MVDRNINKKACYIPQEYGATASLLLNKPHDLKHVMLARYECLTSVIIDVLTRNDQV